jgi:hypothetical protein
MIAQAQAPCFDRRWLILEKGWTFPRGAVPNETSRRNFSCSPCKTRDPFRGAGLGLRESPGHIQENRSQAASPSSGLLLQALVRKSILLRADEVMD